MPEYKTIGLFSPIILVFFRVIQGIALGGESPGAVSFVEEYIPEGKKTFGISFVFSAICSGYLLASLVTTILYCFFNSNQIYDYGWRAAFLLGGSLGFIVCILRSKMSDTPVFEELLKNNQILRYPLIQLLKGNFKNCILGVMIMLFTTYGIIFIFTLPDFLSLYTHYYSHEYVLKINSLAIVLLIILGIIFGYVIDKLKLNIYLLYTVICFVIVALIFPLFIMLQKQNNIGLIFTYAIFAISFSMIGGIAYHILTKLFPDTVKYSGLGLVINIGTILGIGLTPLVSIFLFKNTGSLYSIAYALIIATICPAIAGLILFFHPPDEEKLREWDKQIRELYSLGKKSKIKPLTPDEEKLFKEKLDVFAEELIKNGELFKDFKLSINFIDKKIDKLKIEDIHSLNCEQQQALYQQCKYLLKTNASNPNTTIYKYINLLEDNMSRKYYTYFYSRLIVKVFDHDKQLTTQDINLVIEEYERDIEFFKQHGYSHISL